MSHCKKRRIRDKRGVNIVAKRRRWKRRESEPEYVSPNVGGIRIICVDCGAHGTILKSDDFDMVKSFGCPRCRSVNITLIPE